ncbi:MAG: LD-carboxypeptidase, partial [Allosphingosinicella sp.]
MRMRIGVVAPSSRFSEEAAARTQVIAAARHPGLEILFHPQCFLTHKHFAGSDRERGEAIVEYGNDPSLDAIWFARGGYGAGRVAEAAIARLGPAARDKAWLGYSDAGFLLAGLYRAGFPHVAHGPMPQDAMREEGEAAVARALARL